MQYGVMEQRSGGAGVRCGVVEEGALGCCRGLWVVVMDSGSG